jgi:serine O-acetyltransferase
VSRRPPHEPFFEYTARDYDRHFVYRDDMGWRGKLRLMVELQPHWAICAYRMGRSLKTRPILLLQPFAWSLFRVWEFAARAISGVHLDVESRIGPGLYMGHFGSVYVGPGAILGEDCSIGQKNYIGQSGPEAPDGVPVIGDRVYLGTSCRVVGGVTVGGDVAVGAGAVIMADVPHMGVVVGNPGKVVNLSGSGDFVKLRTRSQSAGG